MLKRVEKEGIYICKLYYFNYYKNLLHHVLLLYYLYILFRRICKT